MVIRAVSATNLHRRVSLEIGAYRLAVRKIKIALESGQPAVTIFGHEYLLCLHEDINTALRDKEKGLPITDRYRFWRGYSFSKMMAFKVFGVIESEGVVENITVCLFSKKPPLFFNMPSAYAGLKYGERGRFYFSEFLDLPPEK